MNAGDRSTAALNRLCKWRTVFAGWMFGSQPESYGPTQAMRDFTDARLIQRAEVSALVTLLIEKGVFTVDEMNEAVAREADFLSKSLERKFPGAKATDVGLEIFDAKVFLETCQRLGFPA